jgi:hypothetical protein
VNNERSEVMKGTNVSTTSTPPRQAEKPTRLHQGQCTSCQRSRQKSRDTSEDVRRRAYEIYQERCRNNADGDSFSDWLRAEQEVGGQAEFVACGDVGVKGVGK